MSPLTLDFIEKLPKTDLHCHLDGSLRLTTILDLAQKQKVKLPADDADKLFTHIYAGERCRSLDEYLKAFDITLSVLQTEDALYRVAYELAEDCARENGDLLNYCNDHRIPLEICLSSNIQTRAAPDLASHPLPFFYTYGLRVTINTDNRLVTDTTVSKEMLLIHQQYGLGLEDLKELIISGFKSAFLPYREKADLLKKVIAELAQFTEPTGEKKSDRPQPAVTAAAKPLS